MSGGYEVEEAPSGGLRIIRAVGRPRVIVASENGDDAAVVRAAAAVLAPSPIVESLIEKAIDDPDRWVEPDGLIMRSGSLGHQAAAILAALKEHATGGESDG